MGRGGWIGGRPAGFLIAAALLAAAVGAAALRPAPAEPPSTYVSGPGGMRALYLILRERGVRVGRLTRVGWPAAGLLVGVVGPVPPSARQVRSLARWVAAGHRAVLAGASPALLSALGVRFVPFFPEPYPAAWATAAAALPQLRGADVVRMPSPWVLLQQPGGASATPLYTVFPGYAAALELRVGHGSVVWLGSAQVWTNRTLAANPANLRLAFNLLDTGGRVWFDEAVFGRAAEAGSKPAAALRPAESAPLPWPAGALPALLAALAAGAAAVWSTGWRRLPVRRAQPSPPAPDEAVRAYGLLLFRSGSAGGSRSEPPR